MQQTSCAGNEGNVQCYSRDTKSKNSELVVKTETLTFEQEEFDFNFRARTSESKLIYFDKF